MEVLGILQKMEGSYIVGGMQGYARRVAGPPDQATQDLPPDVVRVLAENRQKFLSFVQRQVRSKDVAEDILQEAFARGIDRIESLRNDEVIVAWFYRVLRNAVLDHHRRSTVTTRGLEALAKEVEQAPASNDESSEGACKCVGRLATKLKPEYAEALQRIEVDGVPVKDFAEERGLSSGNAGVRVFRAREALRKLVTACCGKCAAGGCRNCTCGEAVGSTSEGQGL